MTEDEARQVELVRAIEVEDRQGGLLTREDREQADAYARSAGAAGSGRKAQDRFIALRGSFAATRLATRHPGIAAMLARSRWPRWLSLALPLLALVAGFLANEFGTGKRLDLLAVPLLGTIAWNVLVYLWLLVTALTGSGDRGAARLSRTAARAAGLGSNRDLERGTPLHRAIGAFQERWAQLSAPLASARAARTLHLGAALFALGLIGGIYLRALVIEYRAGWESTFLGPEAVNTVLTAVLGPASMATGVAIPDVAGVAAMRWTGPQTGGVNAGPWIYLYTATVVALVVIPRMVLAAWQGAKAFRLARHFPVAGREDFYIRRLLRGAGGPPANARITPYAYHPGEETRRRLAAVLRDALGDGAQIRFDEAVDYGAEEGWITAHPPSPEDDYHVLLFTLSATPEAENHGALADELAARIAQDAPGCVTAALLDETPFRAHFAGQAGLDERMATRLEAWRSVLSSAGIVPLGVDLSHEADEALAQRIESGLLPDGALRG
ncbi:DUF2868 domain-containing protein [Qipengyuania marisflavi]|uniref:DUF2868 domain-containing protein n=1 Tax=Qipengyuania marisflavi TaxID=2486356 RepID=A0A5S3P4U4_9SPHN|nr:DUF2868 domain-containing protein [Qipengyuania marisflavi]TMM48059.1 DUF2868 domain-containing protein [Qipengyuania marisflavi]